MTVASAATGAPGSRRRRLLGSSLPRAWLIVAAALPLVLLVGLGAWLAFRGSAPATAQVGRSAPDFALADLDGNPVRLADLRGHPVIVNFWASWCGPCVEEFPLLDRAFADHQGEGLVIIGIVYRDNSEAARDFMQRMGAGWTAAMDPGEAVAAGYGIYGPPETFFIDRDGKVAGRQVGQLTAADMERQVALILGKE